MRQPTAFDHALELHDLRVAAEMYAASHGEPGSAGYRAAWLRFRRRIHSIEDLQRLRAASAPRQSIGQTPTARANGQLPGRSAPAGRSR
jgi:hypothetical protein